MESIFAQTYPNFELIIIDDGSTDGSAEVVASFLDERIVYIRQKNHGVSVARNKGILAASNELVAFIDADDLWQPDHLMVMRELYHIYPAANIWATGYTILSSDGKHQKQIFMADGFLSIKAYIQAFLNSIPIAWTSALMVRRQSALAAGGFPIEHSHGEDVALWLNLVMRSKGIAISHKITSIYRQTSNGLAATLVTRPDACMSDIVERHLSLSWGGGKDCF
jgi:glycosyltransferase involved in cell wall biosynthesis